MARIIQQFLSRLERLPSSLRDSYIARWMRELNEEQGDGTVKQPPRFEDIERLAASLNDAPDALSANPGYMEGVGEKLNLKYEDIEHLAGIFEGPGDLSTNPTYLDDLGKK